MYIPFHKPYLDKQEIDAVSRVIRNGLIGSGAFVKRFERLFGKLVGASHSIAVNSCTSALHLASEKGHQLYDYMLEEFS